MRMFLCHLSNHLETSLCNLKQCLAPLNLLRQDLIVPNGVSTLTCLGSLRAALHGVSASAVQRENGVNLGGAASERDVNGILFIFH